MLDHPKRKHQKACIPVPSVNTKVDTNKAQNSIDLCQLAAMTSNARATDLRWKYRFEAWHSANVIWRPKWDEWGNRKGNEFVALLADAAKAKGFFSIWFQAFHDVPLVKQTLVSQFTGTHTGSFDIARSYDPVLRVAGDL